MNHETRTNILLLIAIIALLVFALYARSVMIVTCKDVTGGSIWQCVLLTG